MAGEDKGLSLMLQISQGGSQRWHSSSVRLDNRNESEKGRINYNNQRARRKANGRYPLYLFLYTRYTTPTLQRLCRRCSSHTVLHVLSQVSFHFEDPPNTLCQRASKVPAETNVFYTSLTQPQRYSRTIDPDRSVAETST